MLDRLTPHYQVLILDRSGRGYSDRLSNQPLTPIDQAEWLHQILQKLGIVSPILVGYSWGGAVALAYALAHPENLRGLLLLAPLAFRRDRSNPIPEIISEIPILGNLFRVILPVVFGRQLVKQNLERAFAPESVPDNYLELAQALWTRPSQTKAVTLDNQTINPTLNQMKQRYSQIKTPTVIMVGDSDRIVDAEANGITLSRAIAHATLIQLPQTNHNIPQSRPEAIVDALKLLK